MAMMAITTKSSISVKALRFRMARSSEGAAATALKRPDRGGRTIQYSNECLNNERTGARQAARRDFFGNAGTERAG